MRDDRATDATPLDYAPRRGFAGLSRQAVRRFLVLGLPILLLVVGLLVIPTTYRRIHRLIVQRACLDFTMPAHQVAFEDDPAAAAALLKSPGYQPIQIQYAEPHAKATINVLPNCLEQFNGGFQSGALLFLHSRTCSAGERFVAVYLSDANYTPAGNEVILELGTDVREVATFSNPYPAATSAFMHSPIVHLPVSSSPGHCRFYTGQPDPANPARFTVECELNGVRYTLVGVLNTAGNGITFSGLP